MKKILVLALIAVASLTAVGQKANVQTAGNALKQGNLDVAKKYIDMAAKDATTADWYKMWYYRGRVYLEIAQDTGDYNKLDALASEKAVISFLNCVKTDTKKWYEDDVLKRRKYLFVSGIELNRKAFMKYLDKDYTEAIRLYEQVIPVFELDEDNTMKRNNVTRETVYQSCYITSLQMKDDEKAKDYLLKLMDLGYSDPRIYIDMSDIYLNAKDTATALSYIKKGRDLFDDNIKLITEQSRLYNLTGRSEELIKEYTEALEGDPYYDLMYLSRGLVYQQLGEGEKALTDFLKAYELNAGFLVAYQIGAYYFNEAKEINDQMNELSIDQQKKYDELKAKRGEKFNAAIPYLELADQIQADDYWTMVLLKESYTRVGKYDKSKEYKLKIQRLKAKVKTSAGDQDADK